MSEDDKVEEESRRLSRLGEPWMSDVFFTFCHRLPENDQGFQGVAGKQEQVREGKSAMRGAEISECPGIFSTAGARAVLYSSYLELNLALHLVADYSKYKTLHTSTMCHHCLVKKTPIRLAVQLHPTLAGLRFAPPNLKSPFWNRFLFINFSI
ncbi:unnamed protein product [Cladocopium goreaui]|uniref:Uncharacterized protein n=1 Tax=Cladocopium goreaui TaxID=2562237 RepID=A0A9P1D1D0_9DINO|nr:unnamed protein product [Cladocopium goreaui]